MDTLLDLSMLSRDGHYKGVDLAMETASFIQPAADTWNQYKLVREHHSFGYAVAKPDAIVGNMDWDDPEDFIWFIGGWGPQWRRYAANAVRKLRPVIRTNEDSLNLKLTTPDEFLNAVESTDENGNFPWGDFPHGGGVAQNVGPLFLAVAVSCLKEDEDDFVARLIAGRIGTRMLRLDGKIN